jgi:N-acetylmuramoyl-L-alanine amidase
LLTYDRPRRSRHDHGEEARVAAPRIITARSIGLAFQDLFGQLGPEQFVTGHYSAGARARNAQEGIARAKEFHAFHKRPKSQGGRGWGGLAYHYIIADDGTLICGRPTILKGAHTGAANSKNIGVNCPGTTGDRPTAQQKQTYRWLLVNAHTGAMPKPHRTDLDLRQATLRGHKQWPGHSTNGCPGLFLAMYTAGVTRGIEEIEAEEEELEKARSREVPPSEQYPEESVHGTTVADHRHVSPEEAEDARNVDEVEEELPEADPQFDEEPVRAGR